MSIPIKNPIFQLSSYQAVQLLLQKYDLHPKKGWGQNFLVSDQAYEKITSACELEPESTVLEIGAGLGTLTAHLLQTGADVIAVEYENDMCHVLRSEFQQEERFRLLERDALSIQLDEVFPENSKKITIVGNLPYQITSPLIFHFLEQKQKIKQMVFLIQKEVADRLVAQPNSSEYGALSAQVQMLADVERIEQVYSADFVPPPKVESTVIRIHPYEQTKIPVKNLQSYQQVVKAAFLMRRKMIHHPLTLLFEGMAKQALQQVGINSERRAETLTIEEFVKIADFYFSKKK